VLSPAWGALYDVIAAAKAGNFEATSYKPPQADELIAMRKRIVGRLVEEMVPGPSRGLAPIDACRASPLPLLAWFRSPAAGVSYATLAAIEAEAIATRERIVGGLVEQMRQLPPLPQWAWLLAWLLGPKQGVLFEALQAMQAPTTNIATYKVLGIDEAIDKREHIIGGLVKHLFAGPSPAWAAATIGPILLAQEAPAEHGHSPLRPGDLDGSVSRLMQEQTRRFAAGIPHRHRDDAVAFLVAEGAAWITARQAVSIVAKTLRLRGWPKNRRRGPKKPRNREISGEEDSK
jgi:hypothetical protein